MRLNRKEKLVLSLSVILLSGLLYAFFVVSPTLSREKGLRKVIDRKAADLAKMEELKDRWKDLQRNQKEAEKVLGLRGPAFTLLSFLEGISRQVGISDKIRYMKPLSFPEDAAGGLKQEGIEVGLEGVDMGQVVKYLHGIEYSGKLLTIRRIKVQRESDKGAQGLLKVTLQVDTYTAG